jgi:hypothetical protein
MTISSLAFQWAVRAFGRDHVGAFGTELEWGLERELDRELDRVRWQSLLISSLHQTESGKCRSRTASQCLAFRCRERKAPSGILRALADQAVHHIGFMIRTANQSVVFAQNARKRLRVHPHALVKGHTSHYER